MSLTKRRGFGTGDVRLFLEAMATLDASVKVQSRPYIAIFKGAIARGAIKYTALARAAAMYHNVGIRKVMREIKPKLSTAIILFDPLQQVKTLNDAFDVVYQICKSMARFVYVVRAFERAYYPPVPFLDWVGELSGAQELVHLLNVSGYDKSHAGGESNGRSY